jgi:hypothetical protein
MAYKVFISYSTKDMKLVDHFKNLLYQPSIETFIAEYSIVPGKKLTPEIVQALKDCNLFVLLWSGNSKESEWVTQEIGIAVAEEKTILPVVLEANIELPGFIKDRKYLPIYKTPEESVQWLKQNIFDRAQEKQKKDGLVWLALGFAFFWLINQNK